MKRAFIFYAMIAAVLFPTSSFAKPQILENKDAVAIKAPVGIYIYFIKEKKSEFLTGVKNDGAPGIARIILDKNDKPQHITVAVKNKNGKYESTELPKSDPKNAQLYKDAEKLITKFVKENGVKQILQKYKK